MYGSYGDGNSISDTFDKDEQSTVPGFLASSKSGI